MSNVIAFTPRLRPPEPAAPAPLAGLALRAHLEDAAQVALDAADKIIAALDRIEGTDGTETVLDPQPTLPITPAAQAVQLADMGGFRTSSAQAHAGAREEAPSLVVADQRFKTPQDEASTESSPVATAEVHTLFPPLPWGGAGNVVAAAGCAVLALLTRAEP